MENTPNTNLYPATVKDQLVLLKDNSENEVKQKAVKALWTSDYFGFARHSMFNWLEYIECDKEDLSEIINTLAPIHKDMKYFTGEYITDKYRYTKLSVSSQIR